MMTQQNLEENSRVRDEVMDDESTKRVIEALIFAADKPVTIHQIKDILGDKDIRRVRKLVDELRDEYTKGEKSFEIKEVAGGFQFSTNQAYGRWLKKLYNIKQSDYLTGPSLETLAIIAYRQPVTRADMEFIRGVSVDGVTTNLLQKGLIKIVGKKEVVGRPFLYGTTNLFLQYFGLKSLEELPQLPEFKEADLEFQKRQEQDLQGTGDRVQGTEEDEQGSGFRGQGTENNQGTGAREQGPEKIEEDVQENAPAQIQDVGEAAENSEPIQEERNIEDNIPAQGQETDQVLDNNGEKQDEEYKEVAQEDRQD
ncbi:SMC-Scp complex subunit ScpB [Candidatus Omnitrophota bacterium]